MTDEQIQTAVEVTRKLRVMREKLMNLCGVIDDITIGMPGASVEDLRAALRDLIPAVDAIRIPL